MNTPIRQIKGIGEKTETLLNKLGISTRRDLLYYYPRRYDFYEPCVKISELREGSLCSICVRLASPVTVSQHRALSVTTAEFTDGQDRLPVIWYRSPYLRSVLKRDISYVFRGRLTRRHGRLQMEMPEIFTSDSYHEIEGKRLPVYALTSGLSNKALSRYIKNALDTLAPALSSEDYLPQKIRKDFGLSDEMQALKAIHFPDSEEAFLAARHRLVFDEFFLFVLIVRQLRERGVREENHYPMEKTWQTEQVIGSLPYRLTGAQANAWRQIEDAMCRKDVLMSRLVQGDVGSGKTILAFLGMILAAENGYQSVLLAPTSVLASQHYQDMKELLEKNGLLDAYRPILLTGETPAREKRKALESLALGTCRIAIGTHALLQENVSYNNLGLVITDEQHRFGVRQRENLLERGHTPHVLVMSATPIPRTLALILYGDLDISILDEKPKNRLPVKNCLVNTAWRPNAYRFIAAQCEKGRQVYIICPMVEESEEMEAENVIDYARSLKEELPERIRVGILHGKMKPREKTAIMADFAAGHIDVLVSTTVVEVGVNVPNATVMMIENAERYGLAQLHQLRGRVGRGKEQSYCIFMQGKEDEAVSKRLNVLTKSNDGFKIASEDLKMRGPGDLFGIRQSGVIEFGIGDIYQDAHVLEEAAGAAAAVLSDDPLLEKDENRGIRERTEYYNKTKLSHITL